MSKNKTILLVDDDLDVLESTQDMLVDKGYDVIPAKNGYEAVARYRVNKPDIVLMDVKMPLMDGYEAFYKIKEYDPKAKVVFITAFSVDDKKYQAAKKQAALGLIRKPFLLEDLEKLIDNYA